MACVENIPPINVDSEMEEGEIIDDLSDISSEEEFLLRERLQVLENYNNVLERKKAKISSYGPGTKQKKEEALQYDLSEISANELDDYNCTHISSKDAKEHRQIKSHHKKKRKKEDPNNRNKEKKKNHKQKKKLEVQVINETSDESEDEYRNRRRKLADAVYVSTDRNHHSLNEKSSLSVRLKKMLYVGIQDPVSIVTEERLETKNNNLIDNPVLKKDDSILSPISSADDYILYSCKQGLSKTEQVISSPNELIDLCTDDDVKIIEISGHEEDTVDSNNKDIENVKTPDQKKPDDDSDEDLELLRQYALKTKIPKDKPAMIVKDVIVPKNKTLSDDEDSDTAELRLICLKSAILKKAIEMKQKQKLKKRLSQSSNLRDELHDEQGYTEKMNSENNTDIESVDMDIGSDVDEKSKEIFDDIAKVDIEENTTKIVKSAERNINALGELNCEKEDELEEDEDLLRAKLLTSLSKNLSNLVNPDIMNTFDKVEDTVHNIPNPSQIENIPEEKRFIIKLGESDSEGEHEATKNLTKMHMKLSEQVDFQQRLDMFLKSTRMEVEKSKPTDTHAKVQQTVPQKKNERFVAKAVKHLPRSEQIEYKNLVKRMAELEKIKQVRQSTMLINQKLMKDTLKPRNVTFDSKQLAINLEEQITLSRKKIAEESAKMLRLKEEGKKMSQKYKIVATELRNIKTALAFNKKQQITVQNTLNKIRLQHQMLLKSSPTKHSKPNGHIVSHNLNKSSLQKENNPAKDEYKNNLLLKSVKVGIENDLKNEGKSISELIHPRLSVQIDVNSNKKVGKLPNSKKDNDKSVSVTDSSDNSHENKNGSHYPIVEKCTGNDKEMLACEKKKINDTGDYKSPLDALGTTGWQGDPNAILCPFEVDGDCKDTDCKYLHTKSHIQ